MAKCRLCKTDIPNEKEYCDNCLEQKNRKTNESYLDSLLSSVANTTPAVNHAYKKNQSVKAEDDNVHKQENIDYADSLFIEESEQYESVMDENLSMAEEYTFLDNEILSEENLIEDVIDDFNLEEIDLEDLGDFDQLHTDEDLEEQVIIRDEDLFEKVGAVEEETPREDADALQDDYKNTYQDDGILEEQIQYDENIDNEFMNLLPQESGAEEGQYDPSIGGLLSGMNLTDEDIPQDDMLQEIIPGFSEEDSHANPYSELEQPEPDEPMEDDFLSLLSQFSEDDPVAADVQAINDMLQGKPISEPREEAIPSDVGEVFSEALKAVTSLEDVEIDDINQLYQELDKTEDKPKKKKSKQDKKIKPKANAKKENVKAKGFFGRIFGNIVDEEAAGKISASEETAVAKASDKKKSKSKKKNRKKDTVQLEPELEDSPVRDRRGEEQQEDKKKPKKVKKVKEKKPKKDAVEILDDYDEISRINPVGASVVFVFFGVLVILLLIGTNIFSYSLSIKNATTHFNRHEYTEAYNQVYGVDIKDEDIEIYDKIMTVMFVNKQLNSYNNYYGMKKYPEALDSLLKGLSRYDKYIELATILGIKSDLDYVRDQILAELELVFDLTEEQAISIINSNNQMDYTMAVYDTVLENRTYE